MTKDGKNVPRTAWMREEVEKFIFRQVMTVVITGVLGLLAVAVFEPVRDWLVGMASMPAEVQHQSERLLKVETSVRRLQQPDRVFEVSQTSTRPVDGTCTEGEPCRIRLRLRRLPEAIDCRLVRGSVEWGFINPRSEVFAHAERVDAPAGRNVGMTWEDSYVTLMTPTGLQPDANFTFIAKYTDCPGWEPGEAPLEYQNEPIPFVIQQRP